VAIHTFEYWKETTIMAECVVCGSELNELNLLIKRRFPGYDKAFDLYKCPLCEMVQTVPKPDMTELIKKEYTDNYAAYRDPDLKKTGISAERKLRKIEKHLTRQLKGTRILDIGCSSGWFLKRAQDRGFEVAGIEMNAYAVKKSNELLGGGVICSLLEEAEYEPESFDVIYSSAVLEHVSDPVGFVRRASTFLKVDGLLAISTVNMDSVAWRRLGGNWTQLQVPDHIVFPNPRSLRHLLVEQGFDLIEFHSTGMPSIGLRSRRKECVDQNINRINSSSHTSRTWPWSIKHWVLSRSLISNIAAMIIDRFNLGDTIYLVARKKP